MSGIEDKIIGDFNPSDDDFVSEVKEQAKKLIRIINNEISDGRRKTQAITNIETACMLAVKQKFQG